MRSKGNKINQATGIFNGRDIFQIVMGVINVGWALMLMPATHLGSMGWLADTTHADAPNIVVLAMLSGGIVLMVARPDNRYLALGLIPVTIYSVITTLAYLSGDTAIPPVAMLQTAVMPVLGFVYAYIRTKIEGLIWDNIKRELGK